MDGDKELCHKCDKVTLWRPDKSGKRLKCDDCGDVFPCKSKRCGHEDCKEFRNGDTGAKVREEVR